MGCRRSCEVCEQELGLNVSGIEAAYQLAWVQGEYWSIGQFQTNEEYSETILNAFLSPSAPKI